MGSINGNYFNLFKFIRDLLILGSVFLLSYNLAPYYISGDQLHYNNFYEQVKELDFVEALGLNVALLSSYEPGYPTIIWLVSNYLDKIIFISICNSIFAFCCFKLATKYGCYPFIAYLIIISNFYFYVCFFSAERLKFSLLFFSLSLLSTNNNRLKTILTFFSIFCHLQIIILIITTYIPQVKFYLLKSHKLIILFLALLIFLFILEVAPYISYKLSVYLLRFMDWEGILKFIIFFLFSFKYAKNKKLVCLVFSPILVFLILLSGERIIILAYFIFMYFSIQYRRGFNFGLIFVNLYFLFKSVLFIDNVIKFGDGF